MLRSLISLALFASSTLAGYWAFAPKGLCFVRSPGDTAWRSWLYVDSAGGSARLGGLAPAAFAKLIGSGTDSLGNYAVVEAARLSGSTAADANLTIRSTSHATKGNILFGNSCYNDSTNRLGIGTTTPTAALTVCGNIRSRQNDKWDFWTSGSVSDAYMQGSTNGWTTNAFSPDASFNWTTTASGTRTLMSLDSTRLALYGRLAVCTTGVRSPNELFVKGDIEASGAVTGGDSVKTRGKFIFGGVAIDSNQYINDTLYWWKAGKRGVMGVFATP